MSHEQQLPQSADVHTATSTSASSMSSCPGERYRFVPPSSPVSSTKRMSSNCLVRCCLVRASASCPFCLPFQYNATVFPSSVAGRGAGGSRSASLSWAWGSATGLTMVNSAGCSLDLSINVPSSSAGRRCVVSAEQLDHDPNIVRAAGEGLGHQLL